VSSVLSTVNVVVNGRSRLEVKGTARKTPAGWLNELEDALWVYVREAPTKTASINDERASFLFIVMLQPD
jgi:hypothetical protein